MSQTQAICLLLFNDADVLSFEAISQETNIDDNELRRNLLALSMDSKHQILTKCVDPSPESGSSGVTYRVHHEFTSRSMRVTVHQIALKNAKQELQATTARAEEDRSFHIDAIAVRLMKAQKKLTHAELMTQILEKLKFRASATLVKERIDTLVDREFLERKADDPEVYTYVS